MTEEENKQRMHDLLVEIETLEKDGFPIQQQCTEAIACLERAHKMFVQRATKEGFSLQDCRVGEIAPWESRARAVWKPELRWCPIPIPMATLQ